jgi:maleate cis-trans isomerase
MSATSEVKVRYIAASVTPTGPDRRPMPQAEPLLPPDIRRISCSMEISDYTTDGVDEAIRERYWKCIDQLVEQNPNSITLSGFPVSAQLGRARVLELLNETTSKTGVPADSAGEATIAAMRHMGMRRVAVASRWSDELNQKLAEYLIAADFEVLAITSVGQWAKQAFSMSIEEGIKLAFVLGREAMRKAPDADGLLLPGGAWRSLAAVPILEADFGRPVITNPIAHVWRLIAAGVAPPVQGWGRLLSSLPA